MKCFSDNLENKFNKIAANNIHLSHVSASIAKNEMRESKCYIMFTFQDVKTQETAGTGLNRLYNVLCLL